MNWVRCLDNSKPIDAIFSDSPSLANVRVHEVVLHQDGPRLSVRFDLNDFPRSAARKWISAGFNCVQLTLVFIGVRSLTIRGWSTDNMVDVEISKGESTGRMAMCGRRTAVNAEFDFVEVEKVAGYCKQPLTT
jgi:hypothetical protein